MVPTASTYIKSYDGQTKWIILLIENDDLFKNDNNIWR